MDRVRLRKVKAALVLEPIENWTEVLLVLYCSTFHAARLGMKYGCANSCMSP